jgi:hypothetical protein
MTEDEIRALILLACPVEQPSTGTELAELLGRGRRKRKVRGYLVMASSAAGTAAVAVLIVALTLGRSAGGAPVIPANQPAVVPATSSSTIGTTPLPMTTTPPPITTPPPMTTPPTTTAATGTHNSVRSGSTAGTTPNTTTSGTPHSSTAGTMTPHPGTTTTTT